MSANPQIVTSDVIIRWDGVDQRIARGTVIDVPAGSVLSSAIGAENLAPLKAAAAQPAPPADEPQEAPEETAAPANGKTRRAAKNTADAEGDAETPDGGDSG